MEGKIRESDEKSLSSETPIETHSVQLISHKTQFINFLERNKSAFNPVHSGKKTRSILHEIGFDFTSNVIIGQQSFETRIRKSNQEKYIRRKRKRWLTESYTNPETKKKLTRILDNSHKEKYDSRKITTRHYMAGGRIYKHSKLTVIDIDAHDRRVNTLPILERVIELLRCKNSCYVEKSIEGFSPKKSGYHIYLKTKDYVSRRVWNNLIEMIYKEFGVTIEVFSKDTSRAVRFPYDFLYQTAGTYDGNPDHPVSSFIESTLEAAFFIRNLPETEIPNKIRFYGMTFGKQISIERETSSKKKVKFTPPSELYPYGAGTRCKNQLAIGFACLKLGQDFDYFVSECKAADHGSKDMASENAEQILIDIWSYCVSHFNANFVKKERPKAPVVSEEKLYYWKDRELSSEEIASFFSLYNKKIVPLLNYKTRTPILYKEKMFTFAKILYSFFLQEQEFTLLEKQRIYKNKNLVQLSEFVDVSMEELREFCKSKSLPFKTIRKLLKTFEESGLLLVGKDLQGRRYKKGYFCTHYKLIPISDLIDNPLQDTISDNTPTLIDMIHLIDYTCNTCDSYALYKAVSVPRVCPASLPYNIDRIPGSNADKSVRVSLPGLSPPVVKISPGKVLSG